MDNILIVTECIIDSCVSAGLIVTDCIIANGVTAGLIVTCYLSVKIVKFFNLEGINIYNGLPFDYYLNDVTYNDDNNNECDIIKGFLGKKNA